MELQEIEVTIGRDGQVQVQVRGVKGRGCLELTQELEATLGGQVTERRMTPEADDEQGQGHGEGVQVSR